MTIAKELILGTAADFNLSEEESIQLYEAFNCPPVIRFFERVVEENALSLLGVNLKGYTSENAQNLVTVTATAQGIAQLAIQCLRIITEGKELYGSHTRR